MNQPQLFTTNEVDMIVNFIEARQPLKVGGVTYEPRLDEARLKGQMLRVFTLMMDGRWRTLAQIKGTQDSEAGVSARLRDLRKAQYGSHTVNRRRVRGGLYEYQLITRKA